MNSIVNKTILERNQKCIINTDLDGILSGLILHNFLNWEIVGFCDSAENIWLDTSKSKTFGEAVFIDMFVLSKKARCIDQHIVAFDEEANKKISANINKLNPNILNPRSFVPDKLYYTKYPFGTVHFIIAILERQGIKIKLNLEKKVIDNINLFEVFLRADDALLTSTFSNYVDNAKNWWQWLSKLSNNGKITSTFINYVETMKTSSNEKNIREQKQHIGNILQSSPFYCSSPDGGYKGHKELGKDTLNQHVKFYINFIAETSGLKVFNLNMNFKLYEGKALRCNYSKEKIEKIISKKDGFLFSYAFVRSSRRDNNFSYTMMPNSLKDLL